MTQRMIKRQVTLGELIGFSITILFCVIGVWYNMHESQGNLEKRVSLVEKQMESDGEFKRELKETLKELQRGQNDILIKLENKENRK